MGIIQGLSIPPFPTKNQTVKGCSMHHFASRRKAVPLRFLRISAVSRSRKIGASLSFNSPPSSAQRQQAVLAVLEAVDRRPDPPALAGAFQLPLRRPRGSDLRYASRGRAAPFGADGKHRHRVLEELLVGELLQKQKTRNCRRSPCCCSLAKPQATGF